MDGVSVRGRVRALDWLNQLAFQLNAASVRLGEAGAKTEADPLDQAATKVLAACWLLERPMRPQPPPESWTARNGQRPPPQLRR